MKKLFVLVLVILVVFLAQKFGFMSSLPNNPEPTSNNQPTSTPSAENPESINRPIIGIRYRIIDTQTAQQNNLVEGAYVSEVIKDSPAEKSGIKEEDIIIEIDGRIITGLDEKFIYNLVSTLKSGSQINLRVWRNKEILNILTTLN